jgi:hypothetical protein
MSGRSGNLEAEKARKRKTDKRSIVQNFEKRKRKRKLWKKRSSWDFGETLHDKTTNKDYK